MTKEKQESRRPQERLTEEYALYSRAVRAAADELIVFESSNADELMSGDTSTVAQHSEIFERLVSALNRDKKAEMARFQKENRNAPRDLATEIRDSIETAYQPSVAIILAYENRAAVKEYLRVEMNRRTFVGGALMTAGLATMYPKRFDIWITYQRLFNTKRLDREIKSLRDHLQNRYGLSCNAQMSPGSRSEFNTDGVAVEEATSKYVELFALEQLQRAFAQYPLEIVRMSLQEVTIVSDLQIDGKDRDGMMNGRGQMLIKHHGDTETVRSSALYESTIHHEIAHGLVNHYEEFYERWSAVQDEQKYTGDAFEKLARTPLGFAREYGTKDIREDIATVWEEMMANSVEFEKRASSDIILNEKVRLLRELFLRVSLLAGKEMGDAYWQRKLRGEEIVETYWE